jgi:hypothetical protein
MRNFLLGVLVGSLLAFGVQHGAQWLKARSAPTGTVVQVYAGDDVAAAVNAAAKAEQLPPALYVCNAPDTGLYILVSPTTLDFALFDGDGAFLTDGVFAKTSIDGVPIFKAEVLDTIVALVQKKSGGFTFLISGEKGVKEFSCK